MWITATSLQTIIVDKTKVTLQQSPPIPLFNVELRSERPDFPLRNQLSLLCNIELGKKKENGNIKVDSLVLH